MGSHFPATIAAVQVILSLLIGAYSCGVLLTESRQQNSALHIPSPIAPQPRGFFWDWLSDRTKGDSTPAPAQRPGDRQDESSSADLTGTWILGYPARRLHGIPQSAPGILNSYIQGSNGVLQPWWPAVYLCSEVKYHQRAFLFLKTEN